jgi:hypothetical protein
MVDEEIPRPWGKRDSEEPEEVAVPLPVAAAGILEAAME